MTKGVFTEGVGRTVGKPEGIMQCPRPSSSKMPVNVPRPGRPENCYQNQREETGGVDCLTKAIAFVEDAGSPRKPGRKGENYLSPENFCPTLLLPSSWLLPGLPIDQTQEEVRR